MKIFKYGIAGFLLILFFNCQPTIVFTEAQPKGEPELSIIPIEYQGVYWCPVDSIALVVNENTISKHKKYESRVPKSEIEANPNLKYEDGKLHSEEFNQSFPANETGETIISTITLKDTMYSKKTGQVLKYYKGHLFLNELLEDKTWDVTIISLKSNDVLSFTRANMPENLDELERITPVAKTKTNENEKAYQIEISPTRAEFDKILKQGLIFDGSCDEFKRIFPTADEFL